LRRRRRTIRITAHTSASTTIPAVATLAAGRTVDFVSDTTSAVTTPMATGIHCPDVGRTNVWTASVTLIHEPVAG